MTRRRILVCLLVLAACGSDGGDISDDAGAALQPKVAEIRQLASTRQADALMAKLAELRGVVGQLEADGELTSGAAAEILSSLAAVEAQVPLITTTTTTTTTEVPDRGGRDEDEDKGKGKHEDKDDD